MNTTPLLIKPAPPNSGNLRSATPSARQAHPETVTVGDLLADLALIGVMPYGLPSLLLLVGWTLLVLFLAGPFLVLVTIVLAMSVVVGVAAAAVVLPYLLVRSVRGYQGRRPHRRWLLDGVRDRRAPVELSRPAHVHIAVGVPPRRTLPFRRYENEPKSWSRSQ
jgi:hypothetical protein